VKAAFRAALFAIMAALLAIPSGTATADELARLNALIMRSPNNVELNLRYAQTAEDMGQPEKALAAYERVLELDPGNMAARMGILRATKGTLPNVTQVFLEYGAGWESNPRRVNGGSSSDALLLGRAMIKDDRTIGSTRWRTVGNLVGQVYAHHDDLSYGYAGGETGPVFILTPSLMVHTAVGGGGAYFANNPLYAEAAASLTFETIDLGGYNHSLRIRGGYREYNSGLPVTEGPFAEVIWRTTAIGVFGDDAFIFSPFYRYSGIPGVGFNVVSSDPLQPSKFNEFGARVEYYRKVLDTVSIGGLFTVAHRDYARAFDPDSFITSKREELLLIPGAALIFHQFPNNRTDLRFDYRYEHRDMKISSDGGFVPSEDFKNHVITMMFQTRM
jgi:tetratricopeptide (TPR) repeat protein